MEHRVGEDRSPPAAPPSPPPLEALPGIDAIALAALGEALAAAAARHVEHVHVEPADGGWRLRHRHDDRLEETLLDAADALPDALARLRTALASGRRGGTFTARIDGRCRLLELRTLRASRGDTFLLTLHGNALGPPRLDDLGLDARRLLEIRALLEWRTGWLAVAAASELGGARLVHALAQELASPERRLLCLEPRAHTPLARVVQLVAGAFPEDVHGLDVDAMLLAATPSDRALRALAARAAEDLLVVQRCTARRPSAALRRLLALGLAPAWLALTLRAVLSVSRVRLLCTACRRRAPPDCLDGQWLVAQRLAAVPDVGAWLARSLETRYAQGPGCTRCHGSGHAGVRDIVDVATLDERVREALHRGDVETALARMDERRDLAGRLARMVARGDVSAAEAARHLRSRY